MYKSNRIYVIVCTGWTLKLINLSYTLMTTYEDTDIVWKMKSKENYRGFLHSILAFL